LILGDIYFPWSPFFLPFQNFIISQNRTRVKISDRRKLEKDISETEIEDIFSQYVSRVVLP